MDFRGIESGGSEISNITYLSENAFESGASCCFPATQYRPRVKEASSSSQARVFGNSSRVPVARNVYLQPAQLVPQSMILRPLPILQSAVGMQAPSSAAGGGFTPFLLEQINRAVPRPPTPAHPAAVDQNLQFVLNASNKESFPVPQRANYDLNSPASADIPDGSIGFSMAPVTPDRGGGRVESGQFVENVIRAARGMSREKQQDGSPLPRSLPLRVEPVEFRIEQSPFPYRSSVNSLPVAMFSKQVVGLSSSQTVGSTPSAMVFPHLASSPMVVTTSSAHQTHGLSQPSEALPSNQSPLEPSSGIPFTPVKESRCPLRSVDSSPALDSVPVPENSHQQKGQDKEVDLNKTPSQKPPRRKKHRPKVIREDKPKKPAQPKTPRPAANKENSTGKRKYVRKTGPKASPMPPSTEERETSNLENRPSKKSCRRSLNFDSQVHAQDQQPSTGMQHDRQSGDFNNGATNDAACSTQNINILRSDDSFGLSCSTGSKPTLQLGNGLEVFAFDLNRSVNEVLEKYISLPENPSSPIAREEHIKENTSSSSGKQTGFKTFGMDIGHDGHDGKTPLHESVQRSEVNRSSGHLNADAMGLNHVRNPIASCQQDRECSSLSSLQNGVQVVSERQCHSDISEPAQAAGNNLIPMNIEEAKRFAHQTAIQGNKDSTRGGHQDIHAVDISRGTNISQFESASSESHVMPESCININAKMAALSSINAVMAYPALQTSDGWPLLSPNIIQVDKRTAENSSGTGLVQSENVIKVQNVFGGYFAHLDREMRVNYYPQVQSGSFEQEPTEKRKKLKSNPSIKSLKHSLPALPALVIQPLSQHHQIQSNHGVARTYDHPGNIVHGTQAPVDSLADALPKVKTKKRTTKAQARVRDGAPHQGSMEPKGTQAGLKSTKRNASPYKDGKPITVPINIEQGRSTLQHKPHTRYQLQLSQVIEEIIRGIENLNIDVENAQNALVPFNGEKTIVLYDGQADQVKKRRPRAKVELDEETNRVWKLLMWKEGSDGTEGIDAEKGKYWEEQRHIFRGRADSFIARMRLVQGDRQFSPWKGSVVDSVVGVFLTQNVSDHLSSSAFMALAARFPLKSRGENVVPNEGRSASMEGVCTAETEESNWHDKPSSPQACNQNPPHGVDHIAHRKEVINCNESFGSNAGNSTPNHSKSDSHTSCISGPENYQESPEDKTDALIAVTESSCFIDVEERKLEDYVVSSQNSVVSSQNSTDSTPHMTERIGSTSESNSEAENLMAEFECNPYVRPYSFMGLLAMALSSEHNSYRNGLTLTLENNESTCGQFQGLELDQTSTRLGGVAHPDTFPSIGRVDRLEQQEHHMFEDVFGNSHDSYHLQTQLDMGQMEMAHGRVPSERRLFPSSVLEVAEEDVYYTEDIVCGEENEIKSRDQQNTSQNSLTSNFLELLAQNSVHASSVSEAEASFEGNPPINNSFLMERNECLLNLNHQVGKACLQSDFVVAPSCKDTAEALPEGEISQIQQRTSNLGDALDVESLRSANDKQSLQREGNELKSKDEGCTSKVPSIEIPRDTPKPKKGRKESEKKQDFDWDSLRREACCNGEKKERTSNRMDSLDWDAVRLAKVSEVADTIKERGMNNMLAQRIQDFLNRLVEDHGCIDLEWLRDIPPEKAKEYLLSIRGLGLKSVECVRLLTLHHLAFPVDTNVGRICVRLGWVPLQPLPESLQLHLLELYPMLENIQKYLWPRLCTLDQRTLYELHYQMITFGKVFCTKSKPNCNSCPMRAECRHFASAFASARLALPGPEEKGLVTATVPLATEQNAKVFINQFPLPSIGPGNKTCDPIIEQPSTPEPEHKEVSEADIEDAFWEEDPDEIPTIKLNIKELSMNVQNYMQENNMDLEDFDVSKALVALSPEAASIPVPKLKNVSRLRTEHQVYELPDSHPLLKGLDKREPDDPTSYLLAIWTPGETAQSTQPPESCCSSQPGQLCDKETCFSCNSVREASAQTVRGTILIPCRTAMRGSFPLNGTYFQVNEVFADHDSSIRPIDVPRSLIWNLSRKTVYFGTSVTTIFRGLSTEGIQHCFWKGFVCVRGFDQKTRAPRPLMARLHFPASKIIKNNKKTSTKQDE